MPSPASPEAEPDAAAVPNTAAELSLPLPHAAMISAIANEAWTTQWLPSIQDILQRSMQDRFKALEQQLVVEQQRQRDRLEEGLHRVEQQLAATVRDQQQQQQSITTAFRETIEHIRREFSAALNRDVTYADVPVEDWERGLNSQSLPEHLTGHLLTMAELHRANRYDRLTDGVQRVTGQPPMSVREFVSLHANEFGGRRSE